MHNGHNELDVSHPLAAHFLLCYLNTTPVAHNALVADALVFSTVALVILNRPKDPLAKEAIPFRLV